MHNQCWQELANWSIMITKLEVYIEFQRPASRQPSEGPKNIALRVGGHESELSRWRYLVPRIQSPVPAETPKQFFFQRICLVQNNFWVSIFKSQDVKVHKFGRPCMPLWPPPHLVRSAALFWMVPFGELQKKPKVSAKGTKPAIYSVFLSVLSLLAAFVTFLVILFWHVNIDIVRVNVCWSANHFYTQALQLTNDWSTFHRELRTGWTMLNHFMRFTPSRIAGWKVHHLPLLPVFCTHHFTGAGNPKGVSPVNGGLKHSHQRW